MAISYKDTDYLYMFDRQGLKTTLKFILVCIKSFLSFGFRHIFLFFILGLFCLLYLASKKWKELLKCVMSVTRNEGFYVTEVRKIVRFCCFEGLP